MTYLRAVKSYWNCSLDGKKHRLKSPFWLLKNYRWVKALDQKFDQIGLRDVLETHGYLYYLFKRLYVFMHKDSRTRIADINNHQIIDEIVEHYRVLGQHLTSHQMKKLLQLAGVEFVRETLAEEMEISGHLVFIHRNRREGLSTIELRVNNQPLYFINFLLSDSQCFIGGVQGAKDSLGLARMFTQKTQGIPPQRFICFALVTLMDKWGIAQVYGVNHHAHVFQGEAKTQYKLDNFNYDDLWTSLEGEVVDACWTQLPVPYLRKDLSTVNAKKRGKLKKRYQVLDMFEKKIKNDDL
uniref:DUF535 domain-containing protein n=1 Tax=Hydrogenovibrio crunogenus (strain DSM 25203 / XCL-2) TaxID=317025 RepID=Q31FG6_HYDCU